jgi:hypothetical protein
LCLASAKNLAGPPKRIVLKLARLTFSNIFISFIIAADCCVMHIRLEKMARQK